MAGTLKHTVRPGGLAAADHERIHALAESGTKPTRIAQLISKHPSTVRFYMYRQGLCVPTGSRQPAYLRNGVPVRPFSPEEDAMMVDLRRQSLSSHVIATRLGERFGYTRSPHTIRIRLAMLAAAEDASETSTAGEPTR